MARTSKSRGSSGFKMRSGNKTQFKQMGSSPVKKFTLGDDYRAKAKDAGTAAVDANEEFKEISSRNDKKSPAEFGRSKKGGQKRSPSVEMTNQGQQPQARPAQARPAQRPQQPQRAKMRGAKGGQQPAPQGPEGRPMNPKSATNLGNPYTGGGGGMAPGTGTQESPSRPKAAAAAGGAKGGQRPTAVAQGSLEPRPRRGTMPNERGAQAAGGGARPQVSRKGGQGPAPQMAQQSAMAKKSSGYKMKRGSRPSFKDLGS